MDEACQGGFWNMLISASGRGGAWEKSLKLERILLLHRVAPTEISVSAAVRAVDEFSLRKVWESTGCPYCGLCLEDSNVIDAAFLCFPEDAAPFVTE